jgi:hypothetical protein
MEKIVIALFLIASATIFAQRATQQLLPCPAEHGDFNVCWIVGGHGPDPKVDYCSEGLSVSAVQVLVEHCAGRCYAVGQRK